MSAKIAFVMPFCITSSEQIYADYTRLCNKHQFICLHCLTLTQCKLYVYIAWPWQIYTNLYKCNILKAMNFLSTSALVVVGLVRLFKPKQMQRFKTGEYIQIKQFFWMAPNNTILFLLLNIYRHIFTVLLLAGTVFFLVLAGSLCTAVLVIV